MVQEAETTADRDTSPDLPIPKQPTAANQHGIDPSVAFRGSPEEVDCVEGNKIEACQPPVMMARVPGGGGFSVRAAGDSKVKLSEMIDLDSMFIDEFLSNDLDFTQFIEDLEKFQDFGDAGPAAPQQQQHVPSGSLQTSSLPGASAARTAVAIGTDAAKRKRAAPSSSTGGTEISPGAAPATAASSSSGSKRKAKALKVDPIKSMFESTIPPKPASRDRSERNRMNRLHAMRSRERKRVLIETLQQQLESLREENTNLRRVLLKRLPREIANNVVASCTVEGSNLLSDTTTQKSGGTEGSRLDMAQTVKASSLTAKIAPDVYRSSMAASHSGTVSSSSSDREQSAKILTESDYRLMDSLVTAQQNFLLSDPSLPDNPIVYASDGFCRLTGYRRDQILGRNCRFLQGHETDQAAVDVIRKGIREGRDVSVCLLNYKADGTPFWNQFFLGALKDSNGQIVNYVGVQCEANNVPVQDIKNRVKKMQLPVNV